MVISVVGTIGPTSVILSDGTEILYWSGINGLIYALSCLLSAGSTIYPVCKVGKDDLITCGNLFKGHDNVDISSIIVVRKTNAGSIEYSSLGQRSIKDNFVTGELIFKDCDKFLMASDVIFFPFTNPSGTSFDVVQQARRRNPNALIHMNVHTKMYNIDDKGCWRFRYWDEWDKWVRYADIVQMNEEECSSIAGRQLTDMSELIEIGLEVMAVGPKHVLITLGEKGVLVIYQGDYSLIPAIQCNPIDTTGCGEHFAAGYVISILEGRDTVSAAVFGNTLAGCNAEHKGYMEHFTRDEIDARLPGANC